MPRNRHTSMGTCLRVGRRYGGARAKVEFREGEGEGEGGAQFLSLVVV